MFDKIKMSWKKIGLTGAASLVVLGAVGAVVVAQTRRSPLVEIQSIVRSGPELGISVRDVTEADAKSAGLGGPAGAHVQSVATDSAAAKAGVQTGDVIVSFDGERVRSAAHLVRLVGETPAGRTVEIALQRAGKRVAVNAVLTESSRARVPGALLAPNLRSDMLRDFDFDFNFDGAGPRSLIRAGRLGVTAEAISDQLRDYFGAANGVLVTNVAAGSPAATAGLRAGDVITNVGTTTVRAVADLRRAVADATGDVVLTITRDKKSMPLTVRLPARDQPGQPGRTIANPIV